MGESVCMNLCVCAVGCGEECAALSEAQLAVPHFCLPRHVETLQQAKVLMVRKEKGARGRLGHELYMASHFKQQPLSTHNNTRLCYKLELQIWRISRGVGRTGRLMMKTIHVFSHL